MGARKCALGARSVLVECAFGASDSRSKRRSQTGCGRAEPERAKKRGSEPNEPRARSRSVARREHEGERRSDRTSRANERRGHGSGRPQPAPPTRAPTATGGTHPPQTHENTHTGTHTGTFTDAVGGIPLPYYLTAGSARRAHRKRVQT